MILLKFQKMHYLWLFLLLSLQLTITIAQGYQKPKTSTNYELLENDSRYISYQDLMSSAKRFYDPDTTTFSELLFDVGRNQVIVGARDTLYRMSFDLIPLERATWESTPAQIAMCQAKGQSDRLCRNYVRVLQSYGENQLYACGTYAFNPKCSWRQMENLTVTNYDSGVGKCPFNPHSNITSLMASNGKMFVGTATDFMGGDAAIIRTDVQPNVPDSNKIIRTKQYNNNWLNNPHFVGSFESGNFIYFLFRESAAEYTNCGKAVYSRIARVCKNDVGGDQFLKDNWTSYLKARLNCSLPGDFPYYFDEIQGMSYAEDEDVLYATFTTTGDSIFGSAVCAFNINAINSAFDGAFKHKEHSDSAWKSVAPNYRSQFQCETPPIHNRYKHLLESSRYQLMDQSVQPITSQPLYYSKMERFKHIALNTLYTKSEKKVHVLFVSTNENLIKKLSVKYPNSSDSAKQNAQTCLIEVWQSDDTAGMAKLLKMEYLKETESLYLGTDLALASIPAQHCNRHVSQSSCLNAMDPYCGWNELIERCTTQELDGAQLSNYWLQPEELSCPILTAPIDGAWSTWSNWNKCNKHGEADGDCMCRTRECNNPQPQNGGKSCAGITTEVTNCTVHGGWTEWSSWSPCTQTCGMAVKIRRRTCGNPKPAFGGRTCVGSEQDDEYCRHLPPCPAPSVDGGWGPWGEWSECSATCGGGFRIRRRECNDPLPANSGLDCPGCKIDYEDCNMHSCKEVKKLSAWTPWLVQLNDSRDSSHSDTETTHVERRFRYACRATTADEGSVRINLAKEETRICRADGSCQRHGEHAAWTENESETAGEWGPCNVTCGGGVQHRSHESKHRGRHIQSRVCNLKPCNDQDNNINEVIGAHDWSCWTEWSPCSVSCGIGLRRRTRKCLGGHDKLCNGRAIDEEKCEMTPCEDFLGWSTWTEWSECSSDGIRFRHRKCVVESPSSSECHGPEFEKTACVPGECEGTQYASSGSLAGIISGVLLIYAITCYLVFWFTRKHYTPSNVIALDKNNTPATSFDAYPNQYSSLPTKDYYDVRPKVKRQSSFNMCSPSKNNTNMGTLNRNNMNHNHTPKVLAKTFNDCETGTLKRNSALNNYRTNIDDEKF